MSAETTFRALLAAHATFNTLVGGRIAVNAMAMDLAAPYAVFTSSHAPEHGIDGTVLADAVTFTLQCWAKTAAAADAVADAAAAACVAAGYGVVSRATGYDEEAGLDACILQIEAWFT
jgi:hypothetical protein